MAFLLSRVQAGALLELAADGPRSHFYSSALPHWSLEAGAAPEDRLATKGSVGVAETVGSRAVQPRGRGGINNSVHPSAPKSRISNPFTPEVLGCDVTTQLN